MLLQRCSTLLLLALAASAQSQLTSPEKFFGHSIGADYVLPNYTRFSEYWRRLDADSDRMKVVSIGKSAEGRDQLMAIVTSPANHRRLEQYRQIAQQLSTGKLSEADAHRLAEQGKAVVWIDGGLHATEVLGAQQLIETCWRMVSRNDPEVKRILDDVIILFVHANPDGMELCSDWYMRNPDPLKRSLASLPRLYEKYAGHDNNRDFYMLNLPESKNMSRVMYTQWFPQIMYNHHQTGPAGTVMFAPPFRDPFNHNIDPLVIQSLDMVGVNLHRRMAEEGKPGTTMRSGSPYSTWWNGGLRTTAYFHNMVGILTETIGSPTPFQIPVVASRLVPTGATPFPIEPRLWKFRESIEYSWTANMSILDIAQRFREKFLFNTWRMARNSIEKAEGDTWTNTPTRVEEMAKKANGATLVTMLKAPELRDAKAYVIPSDQADFPTAVRFVNTLIENGVQVERAAGSFEAGGKRYPAGSLVVRCSQAFRPHILDMFEPQDHPNDFPAPGAPPTAPYDNAGYTLAYQMGVQFDRLVDRAPEGRFEVAGGVMPMPSGLLLGPSNGVAYHLSPSQNDTFAVISRVLAAKQPVFRLANGDFEVDGEIGRKIIEDGAAQRGVTVRRSVVRSEAGLTAVKPLRVALWDRYGGSMESGWTRLVLEQFEIPFTVVYAKELDAGNLKDKYDVIIFPNGAIPSGQGRGAGQVPENIPDEFLPMIGSVSVSATVPKLKEFMEAGGSVVTIGSSTSLGYHLGLPLENALVGENGRALPNTQYYVPGSVLRVKVDNTAPSAWGMGEVADVMFDNSPVFRFKSGAEEAGLRRVAWFDTDKPLRSGWAWGQEKLKDGIAIAEAKVGSGKLYLFGPEVLFRGQPHGTFKFVFNAIVNG
ncbi:MAG: M14 metallopeptidase family protein [Fimbriimonas sp.]